MSEPKGVFIENSTLAYFKGHTGKAILYSQMKYWSKEYDDGWFYNTYQEWAKQLFQSPHSIRNWIKEFVELGIIEKHVTYKKTRNGDLTSTKTTYYKLAEEKLNDQRGRLQNDQRGSFESTGEVVSSIGSEITTENTTKSRKSENRHSDSECVEQASPVSLSVNVESLINEEETISPNKEDVIIENSKLKKDEEETTNMTSAEENKKLTQYAEEGSFGDSEKESRKLRYTDFDWECAERLRTTLKQKEYSLYGSAAKWADAFRLLRKVGGVSNELIGEVLDHYLSIKDRWGERYVAMAYCGESFRKNFNNLKTQMLRDKAEKAKETPVRKETETERIRRILRKRKAKNEENLEKSEKNEEVCA